MMMILKVVTVFLVGIVLVVLGIDDWTAHCDKCKCKWVGGKKLADCKNLSLVEVPTMLSTEVREIDFSFNPFYELKAREFSTANLNDVHKLKFQNCSIGDINFTAFEGLSLLIELDLSYNNINKLSPKVFHSNVRLRIINLSYNNLTKLEPALFENMTHLQRVLLNNNALTSINSEAFGTNCTVHNIDLRYNNLQTVDGHFLDNFPRISSLDLVGNPWICDCNLEKFRTISVSKNLITSTTLCKEPERLREEAWDNPKIVFACVPEILEIVSGSTLPVEINTNYTVSCKVRGSPDPDVNWWSNSRIIDRDPRQNVQKYVTSKNQIGYVIWYNLTIININYRDRGEYKCVAKNPGGNAEGNVTLTVRIGGDGDGSIYVMSSSSPLAWIIGLSVGAFILLIVIFILICYCCRRNSRDNNIMSKNRRLSQSNEFISLDGHPNDMDKSLITEVNPILKPPRQHSVPQSINSGGTEVSETKKMLMDNDSMYDEDSRSLELDSRYPPKTSNHRIDYRGEAHYPPDLLSFPPHAIPQVSPAGSSASTVADTSRLPAHHGPQSPLHSPMYDNMYRTLPYSRSHSPFTSPHSGLPVRVPRQGGYVTIPRRPRQSWSSEPPPCSETGEPLYDNLGLRTTATGSSVLSLNRIGGDNTSTPKASTPVKPMYPLSPNLVSLPCDPIAEQESPPTVAATLPRSLSAQRALSPNADLMRANWTRSPELIDSRRESTASLLPTPDGKTPKIPPRPPPKPKKRASTGPLFEDEGEDGTEV